MLRSRLTRNMAALLSSNVGSAGLSLLLSILIGRGLGESGLGVYATALAWVFPLSLVAEFGLSTLITREVAQNPGQAHLYLTATTPLRVVWGGGLALLLIAAAPLLSTNQAVISGLWLSAPLVIILPFFGAFTAVFRAMESMWPIAWLNLGMLGVQVILSFAALAAGQGILAVLAINTCTSAGQLVAAWVVYRLRFFSAPAEQAKLPIRRLLRQGWPFALAGILAALQARASILLLEQLTDTAQVGYFAASSRFIEAGRMMPNAFFGALFPMLAALKRDPIALHRMFMRAMLGLGMFGLLAGLGVALFAGEVIRLTYGPDFAPATAVLRLLGWSLLPALLRAGQTLYWYAQGQESFTNQVTIITLFVQLVLALWWIPRYGGVGAAWITLVTESTAFILLLRLLALRRRAKAS